MKAKFDRPVAWAIAVCALALVGCDSVKDVRSGPFTPLPSETEVLKGVINGLGGGRSITLQYNTNPDDAASFLGAQPSAPTTGPVALPFSFGSLKTGTAYNITVTGQPFGKICTPVSGASGTLTKGVETNVVIECANTIRRRDLVVKIPTTPAVFRGLNEARVVLTTGEQMYSKPASEAVLAAAGTHYELTFPNSLYDATGQPSAFTWSVSASFTDPEGKEGRCQVTGGAGTNPSTAVTPPATTPPPLTTPVIGLDVAQVTSACQFTISGSLAYNAPPGGTTETGTFAGCTGTQAQQQADPDCLVLEIRDVQAKVKATYAVSQYGNFTFSDATTGNPLKFSSTIDSVYDVAVKNHPTGRVCLVGDAGAISLYRTGTFNPVDITSTGSLGSGVTNARAWGTRLNVFCRVRPVSAPIVSGTYRPTKWVWTAATAGSLPLTVTYDNYDITKHNAGSSDMLTLFDDGTFLFGTHAQVTQSLPDGTGGAGYSAQVEHGYYDYVDADNNPATANGTLRFTLITDTNPTAVFPSAFGTVASPASSAAGRNGTAGLSAMPGPTVTGTPVACSSTGTPAGCGGIGIWHAVLNNVQKTPFTFGQGVNAAQSLSRITGTFGTSPRLDWTLTEPQSVGNEFTGSWISRDHRRFWVWDYLTNYGMHVGVVGGAPSVNDACFTMPDVRVSFGIYTRRGSNTGCYPFDRPLPGAFFTSSFVQSVDFFLTNITLSSNVFVGVAGLNLNVVPPTSATVANSRLIPQFGTTAAATLPGFIGRIPGGNVAADGRSPSPTLFLIAPAASFEAKVANTFFADTGQQAAVYFDDLATVGAFTDWCQGDILGIRTTLNGSPINYPVYLCRNRAQ
jgi:hypothetical protein